jgi:hypothetical protein
MQRVAGQLLPQRNARFFFLLSRYYYTMKEKKQSPPLFSFDAALAHGTIVSCSCSEVGRSRKTEGLWPLLAKPPGLIMVHHRDGRTIIVVADIYTQQNNLVQFL